MPVAACGSDRACACRSRAGAGHRRGWQHPGNL